MVLLKAKSFLQFQIAHNNAHAPTQICLAVSASIPTSHVPKNDLTKFEGVMLKAICTERHNTLAIGQSKKRCLIVSSRSQKLHLVDHVQLRLIKLSFVEILSCPPVCLDWLLELFYDFPIRNIEVLPPITSLKLWHIACDF